MKNTLSFLLCFLFLEGHAQDSIQLRSTYLPRHVYRQSVTQKFHMLMIYAGSDSLINVLKQKGIENPTTYNRETSISAVITTGAMNSKKIFPVNLVFNDAKDKEGNIIIPGNTKMTGTVKENAMPVYDSVVSDKMDSAAKAQFLQSFKNILSQLFLPDKRMAVGDTFSITYPLNFPAAFVNIRMIFTTVYKLINVKNNVAHFTINLTYTLNMANEHFAATGGGSGSGVMDVDLLNQYPVKYISSYTLHISANKNGITMHADMDGSSDSENTIIKKQ